MRAESLDALVVESGSRVVGNGLVEAVVSATDPGRLRLERWDGKEAIVTESLEHDGVTYSAPLIVPGLMSAVRFPPASKPFASPQELIGRLRQFLSMYALLLPPALDLLVAFVVASWLGDCTPLAPTVYLVGPDSSTRLVLNLLGLLCRYPVFLGDADFAALATLPAGLGATLLIDPRNLSRSVTRVLRASNHRDFRIRRGNRCVDLYGAKVFVCNAEPPPEEGCGLSAFLPPAQTALPILSDAEACAATEDFQAELLRYRMVHHARVRNAEIEDFRLAPGMRDQAVTWLAPIVDCAGLEESVIEALSRRTRETAGERFTDLRCIALEAALAFCHKPRVEHFFVRELAETMTNLLMGRHEDGEVSAKRAGSILRSIGLFSERVTNGYKITLTDAVRVQIHQLAQAHQILSVQDGVSRCGHCPGLKAES